MSSMSNFRIDVTALDSEQLEFAVRLAMSNSSKAVGWEQSPSVGLVLFWTQKPGMNAFPVALDPAGVADMVWRWLQEADYGKEPRHDGSNSKGWRIYNEAWGHVNGHYQGIFAVQPVWAEHGK